MPPGNIGQTPTRCRAGVQNPDGHEWLNSDT